MKSRSCSAEISGRIFEGGKPHPVCSAPASSDKARASSDARTRHSVAALPETYRSTKASGKAPLVKNAALHPLRVRPRKERAEGTPRFLHAGAQSHLLARRLRHRCEISGDFHRKIGGPQLARGRLVEHAGRPPVHRSRARLRGATWAPDDGFRAPRRTPG